MGMLMKKLQKVWHIQDCIKIGYRNNRILWISGFEHDNDIQFEHQQNYRIIEFQMIRIYNNANSLENVHKGKE